LDMAGLDISWARRKRLAKHRDPLERYVKLGDALCEAGRLGQKTGAGYYVYPEGSRTGVPDPAVDEILAGLRHENEISPRNFTKSQIQTRALLAMVNTGAHLIDTGIARRPGDVDVVMMLGYGFPRWHGGPMQWADATGLLHLRNQLTELADNEDSKFWAPSPLFEKLIKNGQKFSNLN
jgi:3-hydroxyacyl-CoA dehydrogenase